MNTPSPRPTPSAQPAPRSAVDDAQVRRWLQLRRELAEVHAKLEYLKLMLSLGVSR